MAPYPNRDRLSDKRRLAVGDDWFTSSTMVAGVEYLLPQGLDVGSVDALLTQRLQLECERVRTGRRTFYDTFDGRLHAKGLVLVHEEMRLVLRDDERERAGLAYPEKAPHRVAVPDLPDGPLRAALSAICGVRALQATASLRGRRRLLRVLDGERKTIVRLVAEEATLARNGSGNGAQALCPRLHVEPVRGYAKALRRVKGTLEDDLGLVAATEPLRDEAVWRAGGTPGGVSSKIVVAFAPDLRADRAAAALAGRLVGVIEANLPGALAEIDAEFLHDLRVAVRRTRSLQRELKRVFPPAPLAHFRTEFRWLQQVTGPTRDLDVYLADLDDAPDLDPLRAVLIEHRTHERAAMETRAALGANPPAAGALDGVRAAPRRCAARRERRRAPTHLRRRRATRRARVQCAHAHGWRDHGRPRPSPCTTCARRARSCDTCSSSSPPCFRPPWSTRS